MDERRVVLADPLAPEGVAVLERAGGIVVDDRSGRAREELKRALAGAAGLVVRSATRVDEDLLQAADRLEVIGRAGVGLDNIDVAAAARRGIRVLNAPGGNTVSTAELAFGLLLAAARSIGSADRVLHGGGWDRRSFRGVQLEGHVLGVVGAGRIGTEIIRRARAFGMRVLVTDPALTPERAAGMEADVVPLEELLERSDFVTVHVPLTDATRGLIGEREIARMRPGAILVNAARGGIVDETALAGALRAGRLAAAALDVYETEPLPADHPLRGLSNVVLTPHLGAATPEAQQEVAKEIARAVRDALVAPAAGGASPVGSGNGTSVNSEGVNSGG